MDATLRSKPLEISEERKIQKAAEENRPVLDRPHLFIQMDRRLALLELRRGRLRAASHQREGPLLLGLRLQLRRHLKAGRVDVDVDVVVCQLLLGRAGQGVPQRQGVHAGLHA